MEKFEVMLTGGHPNSLGRTVDVVDMVLARPKRFDDLFACYASDDPVVRLRVSSAMKRIEIARRDLLLPYLDRFIDEIGMLDQASARWTLAQLFGRMAEDMTLMQRKRATRLMQRNLTDQNDWIALNMTMETLTDWSAGDDALREWLLPHLKRLARDRRNSVSARARKFSARLVGETR